MPNSCPDCGAEIGVVERAARVLHGTCGDCGSTFTIVRDAPPTAGTVASAPVPASSPPLSVPLASAPAVSAPPARPHPPAFAPTCRSCGAELALRASSDTSFEARCSSCRSTVTYVLSRPRAAPTTPASPRPIPGGRGGPGGPALSKARPCRECGGPLRFSTDPQGNVRAECSTCGNRFTLPPRREFGGGGGPRRAERSFDASYRRSNRWIRKPDRLPRFRGSIGAYRPSGSRPGHDQDPRAERRRRRTGRE